MSLQAPTHLGRYEILDEIGRGAMGVVYLAKDPLIGRLVALKTFRVGSALQGSDLETFRARFIREAQSAGILTHPNIVTIHDVVEESEEGVTFIAMEYVRGTNLKEILRTEGRLEPEEAAHVVSEVAEGLEYAHSRGVIHRDVKPANILLTEERRVKLTDFGIARIGSSNLTFDGQLLGTPNYMAPEQIRGDAADHRADVFSLGVVLYEMLTGEKPFQGENVTVVTHRIAYEEPIPPDEHGASLPEPIERVIETALAKEPAERFPSVALMARALREAVEEVRAQEALNETQEIPPAGAPPVAVPGGAEAGPAARPSAGLGDSARRLATGFAAGLTRVRQRLSGAAPAGSGTPGAPARAAAVGRAPRPVVLGVALAAVALAAVGLVAWMVLGSTGEPGAPERAEATGAVVDSGPAEEGGDRSSSPPGANGLEAQRRAAEPVLRQADAALEAGQPETALELLRVAEGLAPAEERIAERRRSLELRIASVETERRHEAVESGLREARQAAAAGRWPRAREAALRVLALADETGEGYPEAEAILARADAAIVRAEREPEVVAEEEGTPIAPDDTAVVEAVEPEIAADPEEAAPAGEALLAVDFYSALPEGVLTVYHDDRQIVREPYRFYRRGRFLRLEPVSGAISSSHAVPPGEATVRVIVALPEHPALTRELRASFAPGTTRTLHLRVEGEDALEVRLE